MENKVINVQMDEETFEKFQNIDVPTEGGGSGVQADDIIWLVNMYAGYPAVNLTTNTWISGIGDDVNDITQITPISENVLSNIASAIIYSGEMISFSNCKIVPASISNCPHSVSNICVECELEDGSVNVYNLGYSDIHTNGSAGAGSYIVDSKGCGITNIIRIKRIFIEGGNEYIIKETE